MSENKKVRLSDLNGGEQLAKKKLWKWQWSNANQSKKQKKYKTNNKETTTNETYRCINERTTHV